MVKSEKDLCCLKLIGGQLALDFSNSAWRRSDEHTSDILKSYEDLVEWACVAGALSPGKSNILKEEGSVRGPEATVVLKRAISLRSAVHAIFSQAARGVTADPHALATLNQELSSSLCRRQIKAVFQKFSWAWRGSDMALDQMLWAIANDTAELLTSDDLRWIKECQAPDCDRLFLDTSRNRQRRWCSMEWCGNREKARRSSLLHKKKDSK